jgi:hypothetical protein
MARSDEPISLSAETLERFSTAIASAVATAISTTATTPSSDTHSIALDPYDTSSFDVATKEGKYQWAIMTKMQDGWKQLSCTVDSADQLMDLFKDRQTQFGLDILLGVPTAGNGRLQNVPRMFAGTEHWDADLRDFKNILVDIHSVSLPQVRAWSGWFMGGETQDLDISTDMVIKAIDPNKTGNQGLVNRYKIRLRRLSGALHFIAKNHIKRTSYNSFYPRKELFLYKDEVTGRQYVCGIVFLKLMIEVLKPHLVVDHRAKERELEKMTLASFNNDVRRLLTSMQEKRNKIDTLRKDGVKYDETRFLTLIFDSLSTATCIDFKADIQSEKRRWIKDPASIDTSTLIAETISLYTTYKSTGDWDKEVVDKDAIIVALSTDLKRAKAAGSKGVSFDSKANKKSTSLPDWRITKSGATCTHDGQKYDWCPHHGPDNRNSDGGKKKKTGMYMPSPHDHDAWAANRKEKIAQRDKLRAERQGEKKDAGAGAGKKRAATNGKLKLAKSFKTALVSKVQLSDAEVKDIVDDAMANAKNDSDDESKE